MAKFQIQDPTPPNDLINSMLSPFSDHLLSSIRKIVKEENETSRQPANKMLTRSEVATIFRVKPQTISNRTKKGIIKAEEQIVGCRKILYNYDHIMEMVKTTKKYQRFI